MARKRANEMLWATEFVVQALEGLQRGRTVTEYVQEPLAEGGQPIEFELRVTKYGDKRLPRVTPAMLKKAGKA